MERVLAGWFTPAGQQQFQHRDALDELGTELVRERCPLVDQRFGYIQAQDRRFSASAGTAEALAESRHGRRYAYLGD